MFIWIVSDTLPYLEQFNLEQFNRGPTNEECWIELLVLISNI